METTDETGASNVLAAIREANRNRLDHPAVIERNQRWTYGRLFYAVSKLGWELSELGIGVGDRIAFCCRDGIDYVVGSLALLETGAAMVPVDISMAESEVLDTMHRIRVLGLLYQPGSFLDAAAYCCVGDAENPERFRWQSMTRPPVADESADACTALAPAFIRFSSGTTGASKGVVLSHTSILERTEAANAGLNIDENDRILWVLQMSHHFVVSILLFLRQGATIVIAHHNFPMSVIDIAAHGDITFIYASPFHYHLLATNGAIRPEALNRVRLAISTAMKLPTDTARAFADKFGFDLAEAYGIIEVGLPFINLQPSAGTRGSVGRMLPAYELRLDEPDSQGVGRVLVRGPGMFDAYFSPWQPREQALKDGWFQTGDLGRLTADGALEIVGREKAVIICAGMKVFPVEVEQVLNSHPGVRESLVVGRDHPVYGQTPEAKIVLEDDVDADDVEELLDGLKRRSYRELASYKVPKSFTVVGSLPKTTSGKLVRNGTD